MRCAHALAGSSPAPGTPFDAYPRYQFSNRSEDILGIFCEACDTLGVERRRMNAVTISVAKRDSVARLDEFVGPKAYRVPVRRAVSASSARSGRTFARSA